MSRLIINRISKRLVKPDFIKTDFNLLHPELKKGEYFLDNMNVSSYYNYLYNNFYNKTRIGHTSYDRTGKIINEHVFPVFGELKKLK